MIWFTADQHFGHESITRQDGEIESGWKRDFSNASEMDEALIARWNEVVGKTDTVYHLGDFTLNRGKYAATYLASLNGNIKFVPGGHDWRWLKDFGFRENETGFLPPPFDQHEVLPMLHHLNTRRIIGSLPKGALPGEDLGLLSKLIALCHYPLWTWERSHYGSWHLHGHSHCNRGRNNPPASERPAWNHLDVGCDCWDYYPVYLGTVIDKLAREG